MEELSSAERFHDVRLDAFVMKIRQINLHRFSRLDDDYAAPRFYLSPSLIPSVSLASLSASSLDMNGPIKPSSLLMSRRQNQSPFNGMSLKTRFGASIGASEMHYQNSCYVSAISIALLPGHRQKSLKRFGAHRDRAGAAAGN